MWGWKMNFGLSVNNFKLKKCTPLSMRMLGVGQITRTIILNSIPWANFSQAASPLQRSSPSCVLPCWSSQPALTSLASPCLICSSQKVAGRTARRRGWPQDSSSQTCKSRDGCSRRARQLPGSLREPCSSEFQQTIQEYWSNSTSLKVQSLSPWQGSLKVPKMEFFYKAHIWGLSFFISMQNWVFYKKR